MVVWHFRYVSLFLPYLQWCIIYLFPFHRTINWLKDFHTHADKQIVQLLYINVVLLVRHHVQILLNDTNNMTKHAFSRQSLDHHTKLHTTIFHYFFFLNGFCFLSVINTKSLTQFFFLINLYSDFFFSIFILLGKRLL